MMTIIKGVIKRLSWRPTRAWRNRAARYMINWCILVLGFYRSFERQLIQTLEKNNRAGGGGGCGGDLLDSRSRPLRKLQELYRAGEIQFWVMIAFYCFELWRLTLIWIHQFDMFAELQFLDCIMTGRFRFIGRMVQISGRILFAYVATFLFYHLAFYKLVPNVKLYALEFLFEDYDQLSAEQSQRGAQVLVSRASYALQPHELHKLPPTAVGGPLKLVADIKKPPLPLPPPAANDDQLRHLRPNRVLYLRCPFQVRDERDQLDREEWILRPCRTAASWRLMNLFSELSLYSTLISIAIWLLLIGRTIGGSLVTDLGFDLAYPSCTEWIQRKQRAYNATHPNIESASELPYSSFYVAPPVLAHRQVVDKLPAIIPLEWAKVSPLSLYNVYRIACDIVINLIWFYEFMIVVSTESYLILLSSLDIYLNAAGISSRLERAIRELGQLRFVRQVERDFRRSVETRANLVSAAADDDEDKRSPARYFQRSSSAEKLYGVNWEKIRSRPRPGRLSAIGQHDNRQLLLNPPFKLADEIRQLQAILVDHFELVRGYNQYISIHMALTFTIWAFCSLVIGSHMIVMKSRALEYEFLLTQVGGTFFTVLFFAGAALTHTFNYRLYRLLTSVMALDDDQSGTKLRWATIIKYYSPKPMYCFRLFGSSEISWMFCLKFIWWAVSAFVVLANFFYEHH